MALQSSEGLVRHTVYQWKAISMPYEMVLKYKIIKAFFCECKLLCMVCFYSHHPLPPRNDL